MINSKLITEPPHYVRGRTIEPIEVIEHYRLGHHLACVVKYISRAGRKNPILEDLNKAVWYLNRACLLGAEDLILWGPVGDDDRFKSESIISDWSLSSNLGHSLGSILQFARGSSDSLLSALQGLIAEIQHYERRDGSPLSIACPGEDMDSESPCSARNS